MAVAPLTGARRLRQLLQQPDYIVSAPGVFDGLTARLALAQNFDALYMVSFDGIASCNWLADGDRPVQAPRYPEWDGLTLASLN